MAAVPGCRTLEIGSSCSRHPLPLAPLSQAVLAGYRAARLMAPQGQEPIQRLMVPKGVTIRTGAVEHEKSTAWPGLKRLTGAA